MTDESRNKSTTFSSSAKPFEFEASCYQWCN